NNKLNLLLSKIPSVEKILQNKNLQFLILKYSRKRLTQMVRKVISEEKRNAYKNGRLYSSKERINKIKEYSEKENLSFLQETINGSGVILHTNLGRAPLGKEIFKTIQNSLQGYTNLEYDLAEGSRGKRGEIVGKLGEKFENINLEDFNKDYFPLIFIKSGGAEVKFKQIFKQISRPYIVLSSSMHNSLGASLEIASFLKQKGKKVEIIHGDSDYIAKRIKELRKIFQVKNKLPSVRLGVIGKPSDWLIASDVDYKKVKETLGISLIDIEMDELVKEIEQDHHFAHPKLNDIREKGFDKRI
ncbi:unnamed protein product, partial [marine sediment metagenome]